MNEFEYGIGTCQKEEFRPKPGRVTLWEAQRGREPEIEVQRRHIVAKIECRQCPLLEACEEMVCHFERRGEGIDGVVAGRYSTIAPRNYGENWFIRCAICDVRLQPQRASTGGRKPRRGTKIKRHYGEQLCEDCYPVFSRYARKVG